MTLKNIDIDVVKKQKNRLVMGRPLRWQTRKELINELNIYFNEVPQDKWTVTGLALYIGTSKQLLADYGEREGYKDIIKEAKLMVENAYEVDLRAKGRSGDIFALKNFGWTDQRQIDVTSQGEQVGGFKFVGELEEVEEPNYIEGQIVEDVKELEAGEVATLDADVRQEQAKKVSETDNIEVSKEVAKE